MFTTEVEFARRKLGIAVEPKAWTGPSHPMSAQFSSNSLGIKDGSGNYFAVLVTIK